MIIFLGVLKIIMGFPDEEEVMRAVKRKITDVTVDELKGVIHKLFQKIWRFGGRPSRSRRTAS